MTVELDDVLPAIHAAARLDAARGAARGAARLDAAPSAAWDAAGGSPGRGRAYREEWVDGLVVVYVEDGSRGARMLRDEDVAEPKLGKNLLRARALANLRGRLPSIEVFGGPDVHMVSAGGTYEASLLLLDEVWNPEEIRVAGDFVVAVPSRDVLMVTGSDFPLGIARLRQLAREGVEQGKHPVTAELFVRRDGRWAVLPAWIPRARPLRPWRWLLDLVRRALPGK